MMELLHCIALCGIVNIGCHALEDMFKNTPLSANVKITHENQEWPNPFLTMDTTDKLENNRNSPYNLSPLSDFDLYDPRKITHISYNDAEDYLPFSNGEHVTTPIDRNQPHRKTSTSDSQSTKHWNYLTTNVNELPLQDSSGEVRITHINEERSNPLLDVDTTNKRKRYRNSPDYSSPSSDFNRYPHRKFNQIGSNDEHVYPPFNIDELITTPIDANQHGGKTFPIDSHSTKHLNHLTAFTNELPSQRGRIIETSPSNFFQGSSSGFTNIKPNAHIDQIENMIPPNGEGNALNVGNSHYFRERIESPVSSEHRHFHSKVLSEAEAKFIAQSQHSLPAKASSPNLEKSSSWLSKDGASVLKQLVIPHQNNPDTGLMKLAIFPPQFAAYEEHDITKIILHLVHSKSKQRYPKNTPAHIKRIAQNEHTQEKKAARADVFQTFDLNREALLWYFRTKYNVEIQIQFELLPWNKPAKLLPIYLFYVEMIGEFVREENSPQQRMESACISFFRLTNFLINPKSTVTCPAFLAYIKSKRQTRRTPLSSLLWTYLEVWLHDHRESLFSHISSKKVDGRILDSFKHMINTQMTQYCDGFIKKVGELYDSHRISQSSVGESQALSNENRNLFHNKFQPQESPSNAMVDNPSPFSILSENSRSVLLSLER